MKKLERRNPKRRKHGCDICHKITETELFLGYCFNVLWICDVCYGRITKKIKRKHNMDVWSKTYGE